VGAITTIVVPDAATTPVNHTFQPITVDGGAIATWREQTAAVASGFWSLVSKFRTPLAGQRDKMYRIQISVGIPVLVTEVINGISVPKVARTSRASVEFLLPEDGTLQERKDLRKILTGVLDNALIKAEVEDLLPVYG